MFFSYNQAIQLNPKYDSAQYNKGIALKYLGKYQEALDSYNKAISIKPTSLRFYSKGCTLKFLKRDNEALQSFQEALMLDPNDEDTKNQIDEMKKKLQDQEKEKVVQFRQIGQFNRHQPFKRDRFCSNQLYNNKISMQIAQQFIGKLTIDSAFEWIGKFANIQKQNMNEVCCYYSHILPIMITTNEVQQIQIESYNAKRGGFANIHYGIFRDEVIAIKEQLFQQSQDLLEFISMLRETSILTYCNHPNITKIIAVYFDPKQLKIWTIQPRYAIDLHEALFEQRKLIPKKQELLLQLLSALDYIHSLGFVHLDIKPKNIM